MSTLQEFSSKLSDAEMLFQKIYEACDKKFQPGCGSYYFDGQTYAYDPRMLPKQYLLYQTAKLKSSVLEIGVYMGHSLLIMLLANPKMNITCIDIDNTFSVPAVKILQQFFPESSITFICGDGIEMAKKLDRKFDFFHIDGSHYEDHITKEFECILSLSNTNDLEVIFDDSDCCRNLLNNIFKKYRIHLYESPLCIYTNTYIKIRL